LLYGDCNLGWYPETVSSRIRKLSAFCKQTTTKDLLYGLENELEYNHAHVEQKSQPPFTPIMKLTHSELPNYSAIDKLDDLKEKKEDLKEKNKNLFQSLSEVRAKVIELQDEKSSLITALKLIQRESVSLAEKKKIQDLESENKNLRAAARTLQEDLIRATEKNISAKHGDKPRQSGDKPNQRRSGQNSRKIERRQQSKGNIQDRDSMLKHLNPRRIQQGIDQKISIKTFPGAGVDEMTHYVKPTLQKEPKHIILHIGTNDLQTKSPDALIKALIFMHQKEQKKLEATSPVHVLVHRHDRIHAGFKYVSKHLERVCRLLGYHLVTGETSPNLCSISLNKGLFQACGEGNGQFSPFDSL
ncbi:Hypothetical predicted protein, partial [Paramuricea clavata]